jgi:hypothetical protein
MGIDYLGFFDACSGKPYGLTHEAVLKIYDRF